MATPKILCIVGPTACGKTTLGILLAKQLHGEVVSVDSMQIYRGMTIGTAAPTAAEMDGVPHHMVAIADPEENWSVARFVEEADRCIQDILSRRKLPILVGGTGLYLDAIIAGRTFAPGISGGEIRTTLEQRLATEGIAPLHAELRTVDPESAERLPLADEKRILRALEVYLETGKTITQHNQESQRIPKKYDATYIGLAFADRADMRTLIDRRVEQMVADGLLDEIRALLARGIDRSCTALQAIGYKEFLAALDGEASMADAIEEVKLRSRQYAKRQLTWLRRNTDIFWIHWEKERDFSSAIRLSTDFLASQGIQ